MSRQPSRPRRQLLAGVIVVVIALAAVGVGALALRQGDSEGVILPATKTYVEGTAGTWQRINPLFAATNDVDQDLAALVFSSLVRLGPDGAVLPDLAELPQVSEDGRTYTFTLRDGLEWHDGAPLTSADVSFTVSLLSAPDFRGDPALAESWSSVEVETPDERTIVMRLPQPSAPFLARNATLGILPRHLLEGLSEEALFEGPFNATPIGSGPYRLQSADSREAVLAANPEYHLGKPAIDTLRVRFFPDYPSAIRALSAGEIDGMLLRETASEAQLTELDGLKGTAPEQFQRAAHVVLYLNNDVALFADPTVRRAIGLALDREEIVRRGYLEVATPSASPIAPGTWAYDAEFDAAHQDLATAKSLLTDAGWRAHPTTGILIREGEEFRFTIRTDNDPVRMAVAGEVARQLEPLGIRASVASTTFSVLRRDFLQERTYDAAVAGWDQGADPDPYFGWHSSQMGAAGLNLANFGDIVADELIAKARTTTDIVVRKEQYRQFQEKWEELQPSIVLAYPRYVYVHPTSLGGLASSGILFTPAQRFAGVHLWQY